LVKKSLLYAVDLTDPGLPQATLIVRHEHPLSGWQGRCDQTPRYDDTYQQMMERCYWNYLQVLLPSSAELTGATPHAVRGEALLSGKPSPAEVSVQYGETGHRVLGTLLLLRPGETLDTRFEYALSHATLRAEGDVYTYRLTVQKQPGTRRPDLQVRVLLPPTAVLKQSDPAPDAILASGPEYALTLETDQSITLTFGPDF
jgi:hypothetical protein